MVYDAGDIARRYVKSSRFATDVMSVIPFDLLMVLNQFGFSEATRSRMRVLRLCRLLRLVRIMARDIMRVQLPPGSPGLELRVSGSG